MSNHNGVHNKLGSITRRSSAEHAAELGARYGFYTFPVEPGGKKPMIKGWEQKATTDGSVFRASAGANIGIALGRSGHMVLDVDGEDGEKAARELFGGEIPTTLTATTGRAGGGRHYYFKLPDGARVRGRNGIGPGLDLKAGLQDRKIISTGLNTLPARWRVEAARLRALEAHGQAAALETAAAELEAATAEWGLAALTLREAAAESGYSEDHLGRLLREETIPNAGEPYSPRIRRRDLPRKPGFIAGDVEADLEPVDSREQIARAVVNSDMGGHDG